MVQPAGCRTTPASGREWHTTDGFITTINFCAYKMDDNNSAEVPLGFVVTVSVARPYDGKMFWPQHATAPRENNKTAEMSGSLAVDDDNDEEDADPCTMCEVWEFNIDQELHRPTKEVNFEYYDEQGDPVDMISVTGEEPEKAI